jgi:penicillin-binding protein 1A
VGVIAGHAAAMTRQPVGRQVKRCAATAARLSARAAARLLRGLGRLMARGLRAAGRALRAGLVWVVVKSPLAEPQRSAHRPVVKLMAWVVVAIGWLLILLFSLVFYYSATLPDPRQAGILKRPPNLTILAAGGEFIAERGMRRGYVQFQDLPPHLVEAVIATEDRRFHYHFGIDPLGLTRAALANWRAGEVVQGGSTITQQLAKNLFLRPERTWVRKFEEFILALWLESKFTKNEIIELYLNRVYFGGGNYGVGAAAHHYFSKTPSQLTLSESALLAGLIKAPSYYSPAGNIDRARARAREILKELAWTDRIDINQYAAALANPPELNAPPSAPGFGHIIDWVSEIVPMLTGEAENNLIVETTIDASLQIASRRAVETLMRQKGAALGASEAAVIVLTPGGAVKALIGGMDYGKSQFNRAVKAMRQPGSAFKPFIYLAAMEAGYTPETRIEDAPVEINGWKPENFGGTYRGEITLRSALTHSSNMAAVRLMQAVRRDRVVETARRLGVFSVRDVGPTLALGTAEMTLLEMTAAYAVFANGGHAVLPEIVERIRTEAGEVIFERRSGPLPRIVSDRNISAMNDMMNSVVAGGTARHALLTYHPAAGKTGTSQRYKDAWFAGYTAQFVGGVWLGNDDGKPMRGVTGGSLPAEIWKVIMDKAHEGYETRALPGTELDRAFADAAALANGTSDLPTRNPGRAPDSAGPESRESAPRQRRVNGRRDEG